MNNDDKKQLFTLSVCKGLNSIFIKIKKEDKKPFLFLLNTQIDVMGVLHYQENTSKTAIKDLIKFIKGMEQEYLERFDKITEEFVISFGYYISDYWVNFFYGEDKSRYRKRINNFMTLRNWFRDCFEEKKYISKIEEPFKINKVLFDWLIGKLDIEVEDGY